MEKIEYQQGTDKAVSADQPSSTPRPVPDRDPQKGFLATAFYWLGFGLHVIPIDDDSKVIAVKTDEWLDGLGTTSIKAYWVEHPDHEVGCIVGNDMITFDANTPEAVTALIELEYRFRMTPKLVISTNNGEHHLYRLAAGTIVKPETHSSEKHPDRIDILTGPSAMILPPCAGKSVTTHIAEQIDYLTEVSEGFVAAVSEHNSRASQSKCTLTKILVGAGADVATGTGIKNFGVVIDSSGNTPEKALKGQNPLAKYYLRDIDRLEKMAMEQVLILGNIALLGQATVIFAKQNTGKTLITLFLIIEGIKTGKFDPSKLIYINMDDDSNGLAVKARLAEEYGFQMVADGFHEFEAKAFRAAMVKMIEADTAQGVIIVLDTLKKFVNTMSKEKSSEFAKVIRQFVLKGGTVVALSHVNKNPGSDGKPIYSGTTDIIDDFDCGFTLMTISEDHDRHIKVVEFENIKRRGNVALNAAYCYTLESDISYNELLLSVQQIAPDQLVPIKFEAAVLSDAQMISIIEGCIKDGINSKMKLSEIAAERAKVSQRTALKIIDKYTGDDPAINRWSFAVRARGAKVFELLSRPAVQPPHPGTADL